MDHHLRARHLVRDFYRILLAHPLSRLSLPLLAALLVWGAWLVASLKLGKTGARIAGYELAAAVWLVGVLFQFLRRHVRRRRPDWEDVSALQKSYRLLMAALFLALVGAPVVWFLARLP